LIRFIRLSVWVIHGSTFELRTIVGADLGANAAAEAGSKFTTMAMTKVFLIITNAIYSG
jgi:hypothetical protein